MHMDQEQHRIVTFAFGTGRSRLRRTAFSVPHSALSAQLAVADHSWCVGTSSQRLLDS